MPNQRRRIGHRVGAALISVSLLCGGCYTAVDGSALEDKVDISKLDVGPYRTVPSQPLGVAGDPSRGLLIEAQRMADNVIGPWEVDAALAATFDFARFVLVNAADLAKIGAAPFAAAAGRHNFIHGFASSRRSDEKFLDNAVLRFADPASAGAAAAEFGGTAATTGAGVQRVLVPGHPDTLAASYPDKQWTVVRAFTAHGPYVFMQQARATGLESAVGLVVKAIDLQGPAIDEFRATDPAEFADISRDPTGLLARTLPLAAEEAGPDDNFVFEKRGALHFQRDATLSARLFDESGTDLVSNGETVVYQTEDAAGAVRIVDGLYEEVMADYEEADPVANLPGTLCAGQPPTHFYCLSVADRYAIETSSDTLSDAHQQVAAQYAMLMSD
jgi:hypothetical protein